MNGTRSRPARQQETQGRLCARILSGTAASLGSPDRPLLALPSRLLSLLAAALPLSCRLTPFFSVTDTEATSGEGASQGSEYFALLLNCGG